MKVYVVVHYGEKTRYFNYDAMRAHNTWQLDDTLSVQCLMDEEQALGVLGKCRDERYKLLTFELVKA